MPIENIGELVILKNNQLIAFHKPVGIPSQPDQTEDKSMLDLAEIYTQSRLHLIHRLDRPASGILLFAKNEKALADLNRQFRERTIVKTYLAIVNPLLDPPEGTLTHFLQKDGRINRSAAHAEQGKDRKEARLDYHTLGHSDRYQLLKITLHSGRHHQIRSQLAAAGHPIKGDVKYGARRGNRDRSIHLHAWELRFQHPVSREEVVVQAPVPEEDALWAWAKEIIAQ